MRYPDSSGAEPLSSQPFLHLRQPARRIGSSYVSCAGPFSYPDVEGTGTEQASGWATDRLVDDVALAAYRKLGGAVVFSQSIPPRLARRAQ